VSAAPPWTFLEVTKWLLFHSVMMELKKNWLKRVGDVARYQCSSGLMFQHNTLTDYVASHGLVGLTQRCLPGTDIQWPRLLSIFRNP
jgi:hypothetical protein